MARVAIVDRDGDIACLMAELLAERGLQADTCTSSCSALRVMREGKVDLFILDPWLETPDSGWSLLQELRASDSTRTVPVIICTSAMDRLRSMHDWLDAHRIQVLSKPFDIDAFDYCVAEHLQPSVN